MLGVPLLRKDDDLLGAISSIAAGGRAVHRKADRAGQNFRGPGGDRDRECAAAQRTARAHRRAGALGRGAEGAVRGRAGGQLDARSRRGAVDDPQPLGRADRVRCRRDLPLPPRRTRSFRLFEAVGWDEALTEQIRQLDIPEDATRLGEGDRAPRAGADRRSGAAGRQSAARYHPRRRLPLGADRAAGRRRTAFSAPSSCSAARRRIPGSDACG